MGDEFTQLREAAERLKEASREYMRYYLEIALIKPDEYANNATRNSYVKANLEYLNARTEFEALVSGLIEQPVSVHRIAPDLNGV